jgi:folylpolyglutamate synthase/dihydropteroate synthase
MAALESLFPQARPAFVVGILSDKNWEAMCARLAPRASRILLVPVHSERTAEPHSLAETCRATNPAAEVRECASLSAALEAVAGEPFVCVTGSLYLIGEAMELLHLSPATGQDERGLNEWSGGARPA